jgi:cysteinyl-tRNA synthetase
MTLHLYNSLTRQLEVFTPIHPGRVGLYACGPTVYNYAHIGNGRMAVVFDVLVRVLRAKGLAVTYVSNITDIDDKIMDAARASGEPIADLTRRFTAIYNQDMAALGNLAPDHQPRATDHVDGMIAMITQLTDRGHAYVVDDHGGKAVLFHVPSFADYGVLSGRSRDEQIAGARVEVAAYKRDPADFILWKPSSNDQPGWPSPWGRGRPGWHIECSVMAAQHLGLPFDIHGGGADLKFPHHENEIAQSCCAHQGDGPRAPHDFARTWVHNGFVTVSGEKMSKSLGNVTLPHDLLAHGIKGEVIRWALLSAHYRAPLDWNEQRLHEATKHLDALYAAVRLAGDDAQGGAVDPELEAALDDDLNTPLALTRLIHLTKSARSGDRHAAQYLATSARLLGFLQTPLEAWATPAARVDEAWIGAQIAARKAAKAAKDFAQADAIRAALLAAGVVIKDTPGGTEWSVRG